MNKYTQYDGRILESVMIDSVAYVNMSNVLNSIIPGAWDDYQQVLNSDTSMIEDLGILNLPEDICHTTASVGYFVPVHNMSKWLYTIEVKDTEDHIKNRFRMYRRDCESALRVTWSMEVDDLVVTKIDWIMPDLDQYSSTYSEYSQLFIMHGIPIIPSSVVHESILDLVQEAAASSESGVEGRNLVKTIDYIHDLPLSGLIVNYIDDCLAAGKLEAIDTKNLFTNLDKTISFLATHFIGEKYAK